MSKSIQRATKGQEKGSIEQVPGLSTHNADFCQNDVPR
jgi:hypothetical protein